MNEIGFVRGRFSSSDEKRIRKVLKTLTILVRTPESEGRRLFAIDNSKLDIYQTNLLNYPSIVFVGEEVRGLKVCTIWRAIVERNGRWAGDPCITVKDIFNGFTLEQLSRPNTFVEPDGPGHIDIEHHPDFGPIWRPLMVLYEKE